VSELSEPSLFDFLSESECAEDIEAITVDPESAEPIIEIQRSKQRRKTCTAFRRDGKIIVQVPARMSAREVNSTVLELVARLDKREQFIEEPDLLLKRANELVNKYLDEDFIANHPVPVVIRWVRNQNSRWGSCTPVNGTIRLSHRLQKMPQYVQDAVLFHELIHLRVLKHNAQFYALLNRFPDMQRASAFLAGYAQAGNESN
jgi:predicted metal-dependent hydrolase